MIDIMSISGELLISVPILEDAVVREELMSADYVQLSWSSDKGDILPLGSYVMYEGQKYSLLNPYSPAKVNDAEFKYTPKFDSKVIRWQKANTPVYTYETDGKTVKSREFDWTFTGTPDDAMFMIQRAILHETGEEWIFSIDEGLPETITISSQSSSIWAVLSDIADQCKTEWWADKAVNRLHLGKCIRGASVRLEVGKNIRVPSVTSSNEECYTRFYVFGSTRNITQEDKVSNNSIINKRLSLDPVKYPYGYKDIKGHYENGVFVSDLLPEEVFPTSLYFEDIYPSSSLKIDNVRKRLRYRQDGEGNKVVIGGTEESPIYETYAIWYFQIPNFDFSEDLIIEGTSLSVHFRSGQLRGREFELVYHSDTRKVADALDVDADFEVHEGDYEIIFDEQSEGFIIPSVDYIIPKDDDEITLFNIDMPAEYLSSAYVDLENKLDEELERRNKDNNSYEFTSNPISFYEEGTNVELGQRVEFVNDENVLETRVLMVEKHLDYSFDQKIRVGNNIIVGSRQQLRDEVREVGREVNSLHTQSNNAASIQRIHERNLMLSMGKFFAMQDTMKMLEGAIKGYSEAITPITVQTMAMMVGDESLQFRFTASRDNLSPISCPLSYDSEEKRLVTASSSLIHLTLGIDTITAKNVRTAADYHSWNLPAWDSEVLEDADKKYYVYARVEENGIQGTYVLSEIPIDMRGEEGCYYLLVGILNAEINGVREFVTLYGFTEVLPSQVTTDYLTSADGNTWLDLVKGILHLNNMAGMSGTLDPSKGDKSIAAWFGGGMVDVELDTDMPNPASSVIRHDGTGYFAKGLFSWDDSTGINLGKGGININYDGSLDFGGGIRIGGTETLGSLLKIVSKLSSMWRLEGGVLKTDYDVLTKGQFAAATVGAEGGGSVGAAYLADLYDVSLGSLLSGDILSWNGSEWVNIKQSSIVPDLSAYATKNFVTSQGYIKDSALAPYIKESVADGRYATIVSLGGVDSRLAIIEKYFSTSDDADNQINKWNEIVDFLDSTEGTTLEGILSSYATKSFVTDSLVGYATQSDVTSALSNYLPKTGGSISGLLKIEKSGPYIGFRNYDADNSIAYFGYDRGNTWYVTDPDFANSYTLIHSGNIGSQSVASAQSLAHSNGTVGATVTYGGNVLVGTTDDNGAKLQVNGNIRLATGTDSSIGTPYDSGNTNAYNRIVFGAGYTGLKYYSGSWTSGNVIAHEFLVGISNTSALMIMNNGHVGIGTTEDYGYKLDVAGTLRTTDTITTPSVVVANEISINGIRIDTYGGALRINGDVFSTGQFAASLVGQEGGGGGVMLLTSWPSASGDYSGYALGGNLGVELNDRVKTLEGKATAVSFSQTLTSGKEIGTLTIDGVAKSLYAPSMYDWSEINAKPTHLSQFTDDVVAGKYLPLSGGIIDGGANDTPLVVKSNGSTTWIKFVSSDNTSRYFGVDNSNSILYLNNSGTFSLYHSGNFNPSDYLPLSGGTINSSSFNVLRLNSYYTEGANAYSRLYIAHNGADNAFIGWDTENGTILYNKSGKFLGIKDDGTPYFYSGGGAYNTLIHSGNIGSQSVNYANSAGILHSPYNYENSTYIDNDTSIDSLFDRSNSFSAMMSNCSAFDNWSTVWSFSGYFKYGAVQLAAYYNAETPRMAIRNFYQGTMNWTSWREVAFLDSNVASATKLATPRTIWGQEFDGTGDVSGNLYFNNVAFVSNGVGYTSFGNTSRTTYIDGNGIWFNSSGHDMVFSTSGNVLIGTTTDHKSKVVIKNTVASSISLPNTLTLDSAWSNWGYDYNLQSFCFNGEEKAVIGWNSVPLSVNREAGFHLINKISGVSISLPNEGGINLEGNVLIGTTTDSGAKLQVAGNIHLGNGTDREIGVGYSTGDAIRYNRIVFGASNTGLKYYSGSWTGGSILAHEFLVGGQSASALRIYNDKAVEVDGSTTIYSTLRVTDTLTAQNGIVTNEITIGGIKLDASGGALRVNGDIFSTGQFAASVAGGATGDSNIVLDYASIVSALGYTPANQNSLSQVAYTGSYTNLVNKPDIYTKQEVNNLLAQQGGSGGSVGNNYNLTDINNGSHTIPNGVNSVIAEEDIDMSFDMVTPADIAKPCIIYLVKGYSCNLYIYSGSNIWAANDSGGLLEDFILEDYRGMTLVWDTYYYRWMAYLQN